jgi:hypothetical protein
VSTGVAGGWHVQGADVAYPIKMTACRSHHPLTIQEEFKQQFVAVIASAAENPPAAACHTCRIVDLESGAQVELWSRRELWVRFEEQHGLG